MSATDCEQIWRRYREGGVGALRDATPVSSRAALYVALLAYAGGDLAVAREHAARASELAPRSVLSQEIGRYLAQGQQDASLYAGGEAFAAFIRGGGNRLLYERVAEALRDRYRRHGSIRLLDIGVGDGLALLSALDERAVQGGLMGHVDLVEPSAPMMARVTAELARRGVPHTAHNTTLNLFAESAEARWDVAQATFSLQCVEPALRAQGLVWLRRHCDELLIAEFNASMFADEHGPARAAFLLERYEHGIVEYTDDRTLVAQGFLVPILMSLFTGDANRNFEQPVGAWVAECRQAGFSDVRAERLCSYWWSDAYLVSAR